MSKDLDCHNFDCSSDSTTQNPCVAPDPPLIKFFLPSPGSSSDSSVSSAEENNLATTPAFPIKFHPPPDSSSLSNSSDSSVLSSKSVSCHSASSVAHVLPLIDDTTNNQSSSIG